MTVNLFLHHFLPVCIKTKPKTWTRIGLYVIVVCSGDGSGGDVGGGNSDGSQWSVSKCLCAEIGFRSKVRRRSRTHTHTHTQVKKNKGVHIVPCYFEQNDEKIFLPFPHPPTHSHIINSQKQSEAINFVNYTNTHTHTPDSSSYSFFSFFLSNFFHFTFILLLLLPFFLITCSLQFIYQSHPFKSVCQPLLGVYANLFSKPGIIHTHTHLYKFLSSWFIILKV